MPEKSKGKGQIEEYMAIRDEIIAHLTAEYNTYTQMYSLFGVIFVGIIASKVLETILVGILIMIPLQLRINNIWWSISKCSTYIRIFFEEDYSFDMHWESMHVSRIYSDNYYEKREKKVPSIIRKYSASIGDRGRFSVSNEEYLIPKLGTDPMTFRKR